MTASPENRMAKRKAFTGFGVLMVAVLAFAVFFKQEFFTVQVSGNSMYTQLKSGQRLLASRAYWLIGPIERNDIVVFKLKPDGEPIIKRVYRRGGEVVDWLNVPRNWPLEKGEYVVPKGTLYVLGDNRSESDDSRMFGPVEESKVIGKVVIAN